MYLLILQFFYIDIDECKRHMDGCQQGCENTEGGYRCTCPDGLKLKLDGETCEGELRNSF